MNDPLLARAVHELRAGSVDVVGADDLGRRTAAAVRAVPRRSWWMDSSLPAEQSDEQPDEVSAGVAGELPVDRSGRLSTDRSGGLAGDTLRITDRAVVSALRFALVACDGPTPTGIEVRATDRRCEGVRLGLSVAYGTDVRQAADVARTVAAVVLADLFGPGDRTVDVTVEDVHS